MRVIHLSVACVTPVVGDKKYNDLVWLAYAGLVTKIHILDTHHNTLSHCPTRHRMWVILVVGGGGGTPNAGREKRKKTLSFSTV